MNTANNDKSKRPRIRIAIISLLTLAALIYLLVLGAQAFIFIRAHNLTRLADGAYKEKNFNRAARYAIAALAHKDWLIIKSDIDRAEAILIHVSTLPFSRTAPVLIKQLPKYITPHDFQPQTLWMSRDGKRLTVEDRSENGETHASLWDVEKAQMIGSPLIGILSGVSDDNSIYVVSNSTRKVDLINAKDHRRLRQGIIWPDRAIAPFQLSSDHRFLAVTSGPLGLYILDLQGNNEWRHFSYPNEGISFTTDSQSLRIEDHDNSVEPIILDLKTFKTHRKFERFYEWDNAPLIFNRSVSVSIASKSIRFSYIATGQTIFDIMIPENLSVYEVAANDHFVTIVDFDHILYSYPITPIASLRGKALIEYACNAPLAGVISRFTDEELKKTSLLDPVRDRDVCHRI